MAQFVFTYRMPIGYERTDDSGAAWRGWFDGMGDHLVQLGNPAVASTAVGDCTPERTELGGFSVIEAEDLGAAAVIAKGCPGVARGGGVEVGLLAEVPPPPAGA